MAIKKGEGDPFVALVTDSTDATRIVISTFLNSLDLKTGRVEVHKESKNLEGLATRLKDAEIVILVRAIPVETSTEGMHITTGDQGYDLQTRKFIQILHPQFFFRQKAEETDITILSTLAKQGTKAIGIQFSDLPFLTEKTIGFVVAGIRQVLDRLSMVDQGYTLRTLSCVSRNQHKALEEGTFIPKLPLFEPVTPGTVVGVLKSAGGMEVAMKAKHQGKVIEISPERQVKKGELCFSVGEQLEF